MRAASWTVSAGENGRDDKVAWPDCTTVRESGRAGQTRPGCNRTAPIPCQGDIAASDTPRHAEEQRKFPTSAGFSD